MSTSEIIFTILFFIVWFFIIAVAVSERLATWWFKVLDKFWAWVKGIGAPKQE